MNLKGLQFIKVSGGGNDFILIDNRDKKVKTSNFLPAIQYICKRGLSVGADGVIILTEAKDADFNWVCFNSDGSDAPFCINGALSAVRACQFLGKRKKTFTFNTPVGRVKAEVQSKKIKLFLPLPGNIHLNQELAIEDRSLNCHHINTGVPHTVVFHEKIEEIPVDEIGRKIRDHKLFFPDGANVDFVQLIGNSELSIRTYERGVEKETFSCGTGAFASAVIAVLLRFVSSPVKVNTRGGSEFIVDVSNNILEGHARVVYVGELQEALWQM
ncbi:diaminopimelate epimerase [candidate division WOR-3 bacterium]|nr:diaminopimelate epimerase [candidate division WOR-3 bacterium]